MASAKFSTKSPTIRRILKEAQEIENHPSPDYTAAPLESDLFEWHFTFRGPPKSVYSDGIYHGRIVLPPTYPLRPPSFRFVTPSGRFEVNREICLSISGHHEETWQPAWGVRTALVALRSFMETDPRGQLGGLDTTDAVRKRMATESHAFRCQTCSKTNKEIMQECEERAGEAAEEPTARNDVEIPPELKLGYKDEMTKPADDAGQSEKTADAESARLAEGFVQTSPVNNAAAVSPPAARPAAPRPAAPAAPAPARPLHAPQGQRRQAPNEGVPRWLDQLIMVLVAVLAALIINRVLL